MKKLLAMILTLTMVFAMAGCGNKETSAPADSGTKDSSAAEDGASAEDPVANLIKATEGTVKLTVWASEEDQEFTQGLIDSFKALYPDVTFDITLGAKSEADAKDDVLADVEAAPDVYAFADDQILELVNGGALQEVANTYTYDVKNENLAGSVEAATIDGKLYAYPMTADNGYFMYYDKSVLSESDVESLDAMTAKADKAGKKVAMIVSDAWYNYSFFKGAGYDVTLNEDGVTNNCTWNAEGATDVAQAIIDLGKNKGFESVKEDADIVTGIKDGKFAAAVSGVWNSDAIKEAWGDNMAACKLPTFTCGGKQVQMSSFSGYKMIGVNPHSQFVGWSMILAEYLTNKENQIKRFNERGLGPANEEASQSADVQASPAIAALAAQAEFASPQRVGGNYWDPANTLGLTLITGNPDGTDLQKLLDNAVEGITAPVQ